ncbi:MAG: hypothetical protein OXI87_24800, partial [Albidovulum sp.]|nr:hypothetical protein [Albidovulum sp.]
VCRVEPGMPESEFGPERAVEHAVPVWSRRCDSDFDQRICRFFEKRYPATALTADSTKAVELHDQFEPKFFALPLEVRRTILALSHMLGEFGSQLGRLAKEGES